MMSTDIPRGALLVALFMLTIACGVFIGHTIGESIGELLYGPTTPVVICR